MTPRILYKSENFHELKSPTVAYSRSYLAAFPENINCVGQEIRSLIFSCFRLRSKTDTGNVQLMILLVNLLENRVI